MLLVLATPLICFQGPFLEHTWAWGFLAFHNQENVNEFNFLHLNLSVNAFLPRDFVYIEYGNAGRTFFFFVVTFKL